MGIWNSYTAIERRNIAIYTLGLMFYKLSFEIWTGSLTTIALSRFHHSSGEDDEVDENTPVGMLATLQSLNLVFQSLGSAIVAWGLRMGWGTRGILIWMVVCGVGLAGALVGIDAGTGGRWRGGRGNMDGGEERYGHWDARLLVLIFALAGVVAGGVELARKVVPREILRGTGERNLGGALNEVGALKAEEEEEDEDEDASLCRIGDKLRRMDALVHIFYELAGTGGAFLSAELNLRLGSNFAVVIVPGGWLVACAIWLGMRDFRNSHRKKSQYEKMTSAGGRRARRPLWSIIKHGVLTFFTTLQHGLHLILSSPKYAWLPVGYSLSLYTHRFLENNLAPTIAKYVYQEPAYYQIIVGGSNLGELLGALLVFILSSKIKSPLPWVRLDALMLLGVWGVVRWRPQVDEETGKVPVVWAWKLAGVLIPISMGWAAGDVSLVAHIQTHLAKKDEVKEAEVVGEVVGRWNEAAIMPKRSTKALDEETIGSLGAVMAVLYSIYILLYALLSPLLGIYTDRVVNHHRNRNQGNPPKSGSKGPSVRSDGDGIWRALQNVGGIQFTVISVLVAASTFLPFVGKWPGWMSGKEKSNNAVSQEGEEGGRPGRMPLE